MTDRYDFAVIGGGIAGASAAYELAGIGSVVLLEREATCGHHSTGRSAAVFTECYGEMVVRRLAIASRPFLEGPPDGFVAHPLLTPRSILFVGRDDQRQELEAAATDYSSLVPSVHAVTPDDALSICPVLRPDHVAGGILEPGARDLDVHGLHLGFQQGLRRRGAVLRTGAGVSGFERRNGRWRLRGDNVDVDVDVVVNAAGAWCDEVAVAAGIAPLGLQPMRRTAFTFRPPGDAGHETWPMVVDIDEQFYFKPEGPHVLASPADETPVPPGDVRHDEIDVAVAIERIGEATTLQVRSVHHAWAGLRSFVADRRPVAGFEPDVPGFFWLAGQGGFGIKTSPALAQATAGLVDQGRLPDNLVAAGITADQLSPGRLR